MSNKYLLDRREFIAILASIVGCSTAKNPKRIEFEEPRPIKNKDRLLYIFKRDIGNYKLEKIVDKQNPYFLKFTYKSLEEQLVNVTIYSENNALAWARSIYDSAENDDDFYLGTTCRTKKFRSNYKGHEIFDMSQGPKNGRMIIVFDSHIYADISYSLDKSDMKTPPWILMKDLVDMWEK